MVEVFVCHFTRYVMPPANRQTLTHRVKSVEHGKPNCLHLIMESDPQEKPIGKWVKEVGKSECHPVWGGYGFKLCPTRKWADFQQVLNHGKHLDGLIFMVRIDDGCNSH
jgi:hypothetical protein